MRLAAPIALRTIIEFLEREQHSLDEVRMVLYTREDAKSYTVFAETLEWILAERVTDGGAEPGAAPDRGGMYPSARHSADWPAWIQRR